MRLNLGDAAVLRMLIASRASAHVVAPRRVVLLRPRRARPQRSWLMHIIGRPGMPAASSVAFIATVSVGGPSAVPCVVPPATTVPSSSTVSTVFASRAERRSSVVFHTVPFISPASSLADVVSLSGDSVTAVGGVPVAAEFVVLDCVRLKAAAAAIIKAVRLAVRL